MVWWCIGEGDGRDASVKAMLERVWDISVFCREVVVRNMLLPCLVMIWCCGSTKAFLLVGSSVLRDCWLHSLSIGGGGCAGCWCSRSAVASRSREHSSLGPRAAGPRSKCNRVRTRPIVPWRSSLRCRVVDARDIGCMPIGVIWQHPGENPSDHLGHQTCVSSCGRALEWTAALPWSSCLPYDEVWPWWWVCPGAERDCGLATSFPWLYSRPPWLVSLTAPLAWCLHFWVQRVHGCSRMTCARRAWNMYIEGAGCTQMVSVHETHDAVVVQRDAASRCCGEKEEKGNTMVSLILDAFIEKIN